MSGRRLVTPSDAGPAAPATAPPRAQEARRLRPGLPAADFALALFGALLLALLVAPGESGRLQALPAALHALMQAPRLLLGFAYVLFVPGYWLTAALFPAATDLDGVERAGLSLGLSVAWVPLLALALDRLPWGLRLWPILLGEVVSVLLFGAVALWRRARLPAAAAYAAPFGWRPRRWWRALSSPEKRIYQMCAAALLAAGLAAAWVLLVPTPGELMTEFYILGAEGLVEKYPRQAAPGRPRTVTAGIHNLEREATTYWVEVWAVDPWSGRREQVGAAGPFLLRRGETVEQPLSWAMPWPGEDQMVAFYLFIAPEGDPAEPYRRLRLWLDVAEQTK